MTATLYRTPTASNGWLRIRRRHGRPGEPTLIWLHGRTADALQPTVPGWTWPLIEATVAPGGPVVSLDAAGESWGNTASRTEVNTRVDELSTVAGVAAPVTLVGYSMGTIVATNYAVTYPAKVSRLVLIAPVLDLEALYAGGGSIASGIDSAYGGSWAANGAGHDPADHAAALASIPVTVHYGDNDTVIPVAAIAPWAAAHGDTEVVVHEGEDHVSIITALDPAALAAAA